MCTYTTVNSGEIEAYKKHRKDEKRITQGHVGLAQEIVLILREPESPSWEGVPCYGSLKQ